MDYGYEGKPWLLVEIHAPKDAEPNGTVAIKAAVQAAGLRRRSAFRKTRT